MIRKIYIWMSPLPLLVLLALVISKTYRMAEWSPWIGIMSFLLSLIMGLVGIGLIDFAKKKKEPTALLWLGTLMAGSVFLMMMVPLIASLFIPMKFWSDMGL